MAGCASPKSCNLWGRQITKNWNTPNPTLKGIFLNKWQCDFYSKSALPIVEADLLHLHSVLLIPYTLNPHSIKLQKQEKQNCKAQERRPTITKKRQRNTYHRHKTNHHTHINKKVKSKYTNNTITINPRKTIILSLCYKQQPI